MPIHVIDISQSPDPLACEREDHRALAITIELKNPSELIERQNLQLARALDLGTVSVRVKAVPEPRFLFVDPFQGKQGGGGESPDTQQRPSLFGEQSSGVGQSESAKRGQELGRVPLSREEQEALDYGWGGVASDHEGEPEFANEGLQAGNNPSDVAFEEVISIDRFLDAFVEEFHLPLLKTTNLGTLRVRSRGRPYGTRASGPQSQLRKRKTAQRRLQRVGENNEEGFIEEDARYTRHESREEYISNAVVILARDASASTRPEEVRNLIRSFSLLVLWAIRLEYDRVDFIFLTFTENALRHEGDRAEWEFFHRESRGETIIASGAREAQSILEKEYQGDDWNKFVFIWSDGKKEEREKKHPELLRDAVIDLAGVADLLAYFEIGPVGLTYIDADPFTGLGGKTSFIDGDGTVRDPFTGQATAERSAIGEFLDAVSGGEKTIFVQRFGDKAGARQAFLCLIEFCEERRQSHGP